MRKIQLFVLSVVVVLFTACHDKLWDSIEDLDSRVTKLEELCKEMNTNISALQTIVEVIQENDFITGIVPIEKGGEVIGYTIMFGKHEPITIYNGEDGKDGQNGSATAPIIGVAKDADGIYYWTLNGEWLLDDEGNKLPVSGKNGNDGVDGEEGKDGQDGKPGADGKDGVTPQLKIENGYWYVSYDNGATWTELGKAVGEDGEKGDKGDAGNDGDSMFTSVTYDDNNVYFTLTDGSVLIVPRGNSGGDSDFDQTVIDNLVNSLTFDKEVIHLSNIGDKDTIIITTEPFSNSKVYFTYDSTIVKVDNGVIEALNFGDIKIMVQAGNIIKPIYVSVGGPLKSKFSIGYQKYVYFSRGNLEHQKSTNIFRFAINQYDTLDTNDGWRDVFGAPSVGYTPDNLDWGYKSIINGGNKNGLWRTLTTAEIKYVFKERKNATSLCGGGCINDVYGVILLPDNWQLPEGGMFTPGFSTTIVNTYGIFEWKRMETNGAIFFKTNESSCPSCQGEYWLSGDNYASLTAPYGLSIYSGTRGDHVRLVQDVE